MRTHSQLCHVSSDRCVVLVEAYEGSTPLGSALGEGRTASEAEDQALLRLHARFNSFNLSEAEETMNTSAEAGIESLDQAGGVRPTQLIRRITPPEVTASEEPKQTAQPLQTLPVPPGNVSESMDKGPDPEPPSESPVDPEDWSEELTAIDLELQRVGWDRDSEKIYLERAFGHASRHRLTRFSDLVAYLKRLRDLAAGSDPQHAEIPLRRSDLVAQGDEILKRLQWSQQQAKDFLNQHLEVSSRQQLSDEQLLNFNIMLEEKLLAS
ncbi:hypothetical protein SynBIOSU31_01669 [Synechococcus sp. BIOS-U3-1]|uniref:hypothetical protein n=1 Tax=Synechococcus sp. BIOS-U3-1 TaxID=1400865 RepID=UPI000C66BD85|nr:hypothetical protein [Synechococcus sp. BIOS-U3-1]MAD68138.1 hypothetical protein [Synechococcus sp. CPC100]QNI58540.1 hypothetical protein SynBIOSU31_01669 [Synechococcus sp. BIOS-U3-1]|tara:strand:- start:1785 stop:2585 length:801 start_codon:yes stop_codon:yes gene_type:complete